MRFDPAGHLGAHRAQAIKTIACAALIVLGAGCHLSACAPQDMAVKHDRGILAAVGIGGIQMMAGTPELSVRTGHVNINLTLATLPTPGLV